MRAEIEAARDPTALETEAKAIDSLYQAFKTLEAQGDQVATAASEFSAAQTQAAEAAARVEDQAAAIATDAEEIVSLLEAAKPYFTRHPAPEECLFARVRRMPAICQRESTRD